VTRIFSFNPDIRFAETLPSRLYTDPVYLALEEEKIFGRTWQLVGRTADVAEPGAYLTAEIGDEAIVVVRDGEVLRGFHNICLHRAGPVATGCGRRNTLQCKYHGWTYRLDGTLLRAPEMEGSEGSCPRRCGSSPCRWPPGVRWCSPTSTSRPRRWSDSSRGFPSGPPGSGPKPCAS
jgi:choline monooxygenase